MLKEKRTQAERKAKAEVKVKGGGLEVTDFGTAKVRYVSRHGDD